MPSVTRTTAIPRQAILAAAVALAISACGAESVVHAENGGCYVLDRNRISGEQLSVIPDSVCLLPDQHTLWLRGDQSSFNAILVPSRSLGALGNGANLKRWVEDGGALVTFGGATQWVTGEDVGLTSVRRIACEAIRDYKPGVAQTASLDSLRTAASPNACADAIAAVPGSHFDAVLDLTSWVTLGMERQRMSVLVSGGSFYTLSKDGGNVAVFPTEGTLHRGGWVFPDNTERLLRGSTFITQERVGRGNVVMFAGDPMFRGW